MKLIILGSGGAWSCPIPTCFCEKCREARDKGVPYSRGGPSLFIEEESILFDTPEEITQQLNREKVKRLRHVFYTHWHPDHTQGMRIFENIARRLKHPQELPFDAEMIDVYIPVEVYDDFKKYLSNFFYYEENGWIRVHKIEDRKEIKIGRLSIIPLSFRVPGKSRYGYLIKESKKKVFYGPCSIWSMTTDESFDSTDLMLIEFGWLGNTEEKRKNDPKTSSIHYHISFEEDIELIRKLKPKRTILTHIDYTDFENAERLVKPFKKLNIDIAYDGMKIEV
ncbi:MAG: MBL fold metallo-hydrolase [Candidatus Aenigmatarchaeota archaeon]